MRMKTEQIKHYIIFLFVCRYSVNFVGNKEMVVFGGGKLVHFMWKDGRGFFGSYYFVYFCEKCNVKIPISAIPYITGIGELDQSHQPKPTQYESSPE